MTHYGENAETGRIVCHALNTPEPSVKRWAKKTLQTENAL